LLAYSTIAFAEDARSAREHFERGSTAYDLGRFADAAREYELAYEAKNDPALLFNIGQAWRFAKEHEKAILAFRAYLRREPRTARRAEVEQRIVEMQNIIDAQKRSQDQPPKETLPVTVHKPVEPAPTPASPTPVAPPATGTVQQAKVEKPGRTMKTAGISLLAAGAASLGVGIAFAVLEDTTFNKLNSPFPGETFDPGTESLHDISPALAGVFLGVGAAGVVSGAVLTALGYRASRTVALSPIISSSLNGLALGGRF
jgi:tetratricopeptide (TPR) repeat protein